MQKEEMLQRQPPDQLGIGREGDAEHLVLGLVPPRSEAQHEAPIRDVVNGGARLGGQRRMPVGVAQDHMSELDPIRHGGQRADQRECLVAAAAIGPEGHEVVEDPARIEDGEGVPELPGRLQGRPVDVRLGGLEADAHVPEV